MVMSCMAMADHIQLLDRPSTRSSQAAPVAERSGGNLRSAPALCCSVMLPFMWAGCERYALAREVSQLVWGPQMAKKQSLWNPFPCEPWSLWTGAGRRLAAGGWPCIVRAPPSSYKRRLQHHRFQRIIPRVRRGVGARAAQNRRAMIKTGLYRLDQLSSLRKTRGFFGGTRRASITLYDKLASVRDGEKWGEQILALFSDGRGAYKRTYGRRFDEFDALAIRHISEGFQAERTLV